MKLITALFSDAFRLLFVALIFSMAIGAPLLAVAVGILAFSALIFRSRAFGGVALFALFKSSILSEIRGSINGTTYSRNRYGAYGRNRTKPVNPNTPSQGVIRSVMSYISQLWKTLTADEIAGWNQQALQFPFKNKVGDTIYLSGQALFVKFNTLLQYAGLSTSTTAPAPVDVPTIGELVVTTLTSGSVVLGSDANVVPANTAYLVEASAGQSAGTRFFGRSKMKRIAVLGAGADLSDDLINEYKTVFGAPITDTRVNFRVTVVALPSGQSVQSNAVSATVA